MSTENSMEQPKGIKMISHRVERECVTQRYVTKKSRVIPKCPTAYLHN